MKGALLAVSLLLAGSVACAQSQIPEKLQRSASPEAVKALAQYTGEKPEVIQGIQTFRTEVVKLEGTPEEVLDFRREEVAEFHRLNPAFKPEDKDQLLLLCADWRSVVQQVSDISPWVILLPAYNRCLGAGTSSAYLVSRAIVNVAIFKIRDLDKKEWSTHWPSEKLEHIQRGIGLSHQNNTKVLAEIVNKEAVAAMSPQQRAALTQQEQAAKAASHANLCRLMKAQAEEAARRGRQADVEKTLLGMSVNQCN